MTVPINLVGSRAHTRMILFWAIVALVVVCLDTSFARNIKSPSPTMADVMHFMNKFRQLPEYAQVKLTEAELHTKFRTWEVPSEFAKLRDKWVRIIGKNNWGYFHHYSRGILRFNEALRLIGGSEKEERREKNTLNMAIKEFEFIENSRTDSSFPLWSQLYMYKFRIYSQLGQYAMAQRAMQQAVALQKRRKSRR